MSGKLAKTIEERGVLEEKYIDVQNATDEFIRLSVLKYNRIDILMSQVMGYTVANCHLSMLIHQSGNPKTLTLAPRGIGKSVCMTIVRCVYEVLQNPDIRILIVSNTQLQAEIFLREIKEHLQGNENITRIFGDQVGSKWDNKEIVVKGRKIFAKESTISCCGVGGAIIGRHYDLIIGDDLVDEENAGTERQREKFRVWYYKVLDPTLEPHGRFFVHGTRYNPSDHYEHLMKNDEDYVARIYPAINSDGNSLWPEKMPIEWLKKKRRAMGTAIFNTQYQNDTTLMVGKIFKYDWFRYYEALPEKILIFQGVDLAISEKDKSCYFVIATIGKDEFGRIYLVDLYKDRLSFLQQTGKIIEKAKQFNPRRVFIEANAYQRSQSELLQVVSMVPVKPVITQRDKTTRAWTLSSKFENGNVFFPRWGAYTTGDAIQELRDNLIKFPDCEHDDDFDALEIAISNSFKRVNKDRREFGII